MEDFDDGTGGVESDGLDSGTSSSVGRVEALRIAVAIIIVAIWALIYLRAGIMLLVVAWLFGTTALRGKR
jgi:hypothetical protein